MGKAEKLSDFGRGQVIMIRMLGTSNSETLRLVDCSQSSAVIIHSKWINDGETRRHGVGHSHVIKEKGHRSLLRLLKQNLTVDSLTA